MRLSPFLAAAVLAGSFPSAFADAPPIVREARWEVTIDWVLSGNAPPRTVDRRTLDVGPSDPDRAEAILAWPGRPEGVRIAASGRFDRVGDASTPDRLAFTFEVELGAAPVRTSRVYSMTEGGSELVEVARDGDIVLLAVVRGERTWRASVRRVAAIGAPVVLELAVARVDGDRVIPLETNSMHTFVGEPVEYSFRLGTGDAEQALRVVLTPLSTTEDLAEIRVQVTGKLPGTPAPIVLSRDHRIVASRGATSSVDIVSGTPPSGYRFSVTPDF